MQRRVSVLPASLLLVLLSRVCLGSVQRFGCFTGILAAASAEDDVAAAAACAATAVRFGCLIDIIGASGGGLKPPSLNLKGPMSSNLGGPLFQADREVLGHAATVANQRKVKGRLSSCQAAWTEE